MISGEEKYRTVNTWLVALACISLFVDLELSTKIMKIRPFELFLGLLILVELANGTLLKLPLRFIRQTRFFLIFLIYVLIHSLVKVGIVTVIKENVQFFEFVIFSLIGVVNLSVLKRFELFIKIMIYGMVGLALLTALMHIGQGQFYDYKNYHTMKFTFALSTLMTYWWYYFKERKRSVLVLLIVLFFLTLLSGERKGWVSLILGIISLHTLDLRFVLPFKIPKRLLGRSFLVTSGVILFSLIIFILDIPYINKQVSSLVELTSSSTSNYDEASTMSNKERLYLIGMAITLFAENPIFGIGLDEFRKYLEIHGQKSNMVQDVHNYYLKMLVELGAVGFTILMIHMSYLWIGLMGMYRRNKESDLKNAIRWSIMLTLYCLIQDFFLSGKAICIFFLTLPMVLFIVNKSQESHLKQPIQD